MLSVDVWVLGNVLVTQCHEPAGVPAASLCRGSGLQINAMSAVPNVMLMGVLGL